MLPPSLLIPLASLFAAFVGGALFSLLHIPLAWMIGAMFGTALLSWFRPVSIPPATRPIALVALGLAFGQTFSGPVLGALLSAAPTIVIASLLSIASGIAAVPIFMRMAGTDASTGYFSAIPGGVIVMAVLAQRANAPIAPVTLAQTVRVLVVVLIMPPVLSAFAPHGDSSAFLAPRIPIEPMGLVLMLAVGFLAAISLRRTGLANPWMIGPCLLAITAAAFNVLPSGVPQWMTNGAQLGMGATLGQKMTRDFLMGSRRLMNASLASSLFLCLLCTAVGIFLAWAADLPPAAVMLGMAPGGMPEMGVTAKALGVAVPLVLGFHLCRTLMCSFLLGPIFRLLVRMRLFMPRHSA